MSGFTISIRQKRRYCEASGRDYTVFIRRDRPDEHNMMNCPMCGKRVTLRLKVASGKMAVIPRHIEHIVGT